MAIKPEDMRADLEASRAVSSGEALSDRPDLPTAAAPVPDDERERLLKTISGSYFLLRRGLAIIALAFPIVLWLGAGIDSLQSSISAYYHFHDTGSGPSPYGTGRMRDVFVGVLWAIGAFLFFYKGYSRREDWVLNVAGIGAVVVALFPMDWPGEPGTTTNMVHFTGATAFFLAVAYVCLFRSGDTLRIIKDDGQRRWFKRLYAMLGALMVALPLSLFLIHFLSDRLQMLPEQTDETRVVLGIEVAVIWVFAAFWLVKSREIALIQKQEALLGQS